MNISRMMCGAMILALAAIAPASATAICVNTQDCTLELTQANSSSGFGMNNLFRSIQAVILARPRSLIDTPIISPSVR